MTYIILRDLFRLAIAGAVLTIFLVVGTLFCLGWLTWAGLQEIARLIMQRRAA